MVWRANLTGTVIINSVDENGTPLIAAKKIIAPVNTVRHIKATKVSGYTPESKVINASFSTTGNSYNVVYQPNKDDSFQHLVNANYVGVSSQDVTTNSLKSIQAVPFGNTMNRLRVVYGRNGHDWKTLNVNYPNLEIQDPSITMFGNYWYISYTGGVLRTSDFMNWEKFQQTTDTKYGDLHAPTLIHSSNNKLSMVFTTRTKQNKYRSYIAPFNYVSAKPNLKKARLIKGLDGATSVSIYHGHETSYALYTTQKKAGVIHIATARSLNGYYKVKKRITPPSGTYFYAPSFVMKENAKAVGITYSSYYYNELGDLSYANAYYRDDLLGGKRPTKISGQFAFQKVSAIQIK